MKIKRLVVCIALGLTAGACTQPPPAGAPVDGSGDKNVGTTGTQQSDWARILRLEEQAKAIVRASACTTADQCRTAPVGSRGCGGPRYYLVYCSRTADSVALFRKLDEVSNAEKAYNMRYNVISTCEFRMPPAVGVTAGVCQAR